MSCLTVEKWDRHRRDGRVRRTHEAEGAADAAVVGIHVKRWKAPLALGAELDFPFRNARFGGAKVGALDLGASERGLEGDGGGRDERQPIGQHDRLRQRHEADGLREREL